jgi:hypothetical protein
MYKILGADQKEYGPVSAEELRRWIAEGRADANTSVQVDGSADWKLLGTLPEFADCFGATSPPTGAAPAPFAPTPMAPGYAYRERTNGMAIAGLVLGILGLFCCGPVFATLALVFSCVALSQINRDPTQRGRSLAVAGIILAILGYLVFVGLLTTGAFRRAYRRRYRL